MPDPKQDCRSCAFWLHQGEETICRRFPPQPIALPLPQGLAVRSFFPPMGPVGWCGEWKEGSRVEIATEMPR